MNPPLLRRPWLWGAFAAALLGVPIAATLGARQHGPPLPVYGAVPALGDDARLTDQRGAPFTARNLEGSVWVADFIFTGCSEACPKLSGELAKIRTFLKNRGALGRARLLSISLDPAHDDAPRLSAYAAGFGADPTTWKFVTGPAAAIEEAVVRGFKISVERSADPAQASGFSIVHGTHLVLIDAHGRIRGYYDANDAEALGRLRADLFRLLDAGGA
jgi:protein SCO1/2